MRVLMYSDRFGGDTTTFIYNDVIALSRRVDLKYICLNRINDQKFPYENCKVLAYKRNPLKRKLLWWLEIKGISLGFKNSNFSKELNEVINSFKPDIIHGQFGYEALRVFDNLSVQNSLIPMVVSFRGYDASQFLNRKSYVRRIKDLTSRSNVYCTFVCNFLKENLQKAGIEIQRYIILHSGTRLELFQPAIKVKKSSITFIQISSFRPSKGHYYTIKAFVKALPHFKRRPLLLLAGAGDEFEKIKKLVSDEKIQDFVKFLGWVSPIEARKLLSESDVFLHHSVNEIGSTEGIPNSVMEAMAMEMPVITTWHAGIPELVDDGVHGYLVHEKDVETYAQRMLDIEDWPRNIPESRKKIESEFEFEKHVAKLIKYYKDVLLYK